MKLNRITLQEIDNTRTNPVDDETLEKTRTIVKKVRSDGWEALVDYAQKFQDITPGEQVIYSASDLKEAVKAISPEQKALLERTTKRVKDFAKAQRNSLLDLTTQIHGGEAGHQFAPVEYAACYAPGGRYPLPSSVIMTVTTARAAEVENVWVASPKPTTITLAAAHIAGADHLVAIGGAQVISAFAYGAGEIPRCDVIVGPGNRWVTAAKQLVSGLVSIDMLAGPSELLIWADKNADPEIIAADLLAQAEHDPDALPVLVTTDEEIISATEKALEAQLENLPTKDVAAAAMNNSFVVVCQNRSEAIAAINKLAPEHLELQMETPQDIMHELKHYGAVFVGENAAEVLGDYGAGPNHVLPTSGAARFTGGLSVLNFLRMRTWMRIEHLNRAQDLAQDAHDLALLEGLHGHAKSAKFRVRQIQRSQLQSPITLDDVLDAESRIRPYLATTPLREYPSLNKRIGHGIKVWIKHENHLPTNAFKVRNGVSFMTSLTEEEKSRGVIAATRGNHGQGIAWAGQKLGVKVTICVPLGNSPSKNAAIRALGAEVIEDGAHYDDAVLNMHRLAKKHGYTIAHSTNHPQVIAGAGTMSLEILRQCSA